MKLLNLSRCAAIAACVAGLQNVAQASMPVNLEVANGTYTFTDTTAGYDFLTGSTVTFLNDQLVAWNITDTLDNDLFTQNNSWIDTAIYQAGVYGPNDWGFNLIALSADAYGDPRVEIGNQGSSGAIYLQPSYTVTIDPDGTWSKIDTDSIPAPDTASTLPLLAAAITALGAGKRLVSRRMA